MIGEQVGSMGVTEVCGGFGRIKGAHGAWGGRAWGDQGIFLAP